MNANITIPAVILMSIYSLIVGGTCFGIYVCKDRIPKTLIVEAIKVLIVMLVEMLVICAWNLNR